MNMEEKLTNGDSHHRMHHQSLLNYSTTVMLILQRCGPPILNFFFKRYQMDLCKKAMEENIIVYLGTGCGKTHIAVLLIYEMGHLIKKPQKKICVFLATTVDLVEQQAKVIQDSIDFKVRTFCRSSKLLKGHQDWEKEMEKYEIFVMTPQILLDQLTHGSIRMEIIALLIFDECHYAHLGSNHPYAEIMKVFYKDDAINHPRIFGMTASPKYGKGSSIYSLETLLHAKVYSVEHKEELEDFAASPNIKVYYYDNATNSSSRSQMNYSTKLEEIKNQCVSTLTRTDCHLEMLQKLHGNLIFCLENLGLWVSLQASHIIFGGDHFERKKSMEAEGQVNDDTICHRYLSLVSKIFDPDCIKAQLDGTKADLFSVEVLKEPFFSRKLVRLIEILSDIRVKPNMKCIIFVDRKLTARALSYILQNLKFLSSWKCDFLVGVHSGLESVSRKTTNTTLEKFRSGELNLLVATRVGEEGLDIQTCSLVIRFDLPNTVASFIQSRGRARMPQSEYAFLVDSGNHREVNLIENLKKGEDQMNKEFESRASSEGFAVSVKRTNKADSAGATTNSGSCISLIYRYCSKLPHDKYFKPKPRFVFVDDPKGTVCNLILPSNALIHEIASAPQSTKEASKRDACLRACEILQKQGVLNVNQKGMNLIENIKKGEDQMNVEIASITSSEESVDSVQRTYRVNSTSATISSGSSISLLHRYCSKLPRNEYSKSKPQFSYFDDPKGTVCNIILPTNAPIQEIASAPRSVKAAAKRDACLKACEALHKLGALNDHLLPHQNDVIDILVEGSSDSDTCEEEDSRRELHKMLIPAAFKKPWFTVANKVCLRSYFIKFSPCPDDRIYKKFGLFLKSPLPQEAERMKLDLQLARSRSVTTEFVPCGVEKFDKYEIIMAEQFQQMFLKVILNRSELIPEFVPLGENDFTHSSSSTFYLMLPVIHQENENKMAVDWELISKCTSSPTFKTPKDAGDNGIPCNGNSMHLANGLKSIDDIVNSLVYAPCKNAFFFVSDIVHEKNGYDTYKEMRSQVDHDAEKSCNLLLHPDQPLLKAKQLFSLDNLLRKKRHPGIHPGSREKEEHFLELPPEICELKIIGFSKDIGSSLSLLPSLMHRLENLLVAIELKKRLSASFPEGAEVNASRILEALTTENCKENFSLERLEVLGDAFLKFAVGRHLFLLHDALDEGELTERRSKIVNNSKLFKLAIMKNLQVYIRDQSFEPSQFFALGRPCPVVCTKETETSIHEYCAINAEVRCNKSHHWLNKKTIADVVEALIGAFIVDSGFKAATAFLKWLGIRVDFEASQVTNICFSSKNIMPLATTHIDIAALENLIGYQFVHKGLLVQAFVHPSYHNHFGSCYQRLEFLGDAVLDYLITSYLYSAYQKLRPGQLTDLRSISVNNNSFADVAVHRSFHKFIICGSSSVTESINSYVNFFENSESEKDMVEARCPKALGDLVESCIGAILLDSEFDLNLVWKIMLSFLDPIMKFSKLEHNPIRELHELCQSYNWDLQFLEKNEDGTYIVEAKVSGEGVALTARSTNPSKIAAKRMASKDLFMRLKAQGFKPRFKSLKEVLKMSNKMEPKLIGFDEKPTDVNDNLKVQESSTSDCHSKDCNPNASATKQDPPLGEALGCEPIVIIEGNSCNATSPTTGVSHKVVKAQSRLYKICDAKEWKPPLFECCHETGPDDVEKFFYKVVVVIKGDPETILECIGEPRAKKKEAAEHAAEGALWYLKNEGYLEDKD